MGLNIEILLEKTTYTFLATSANDALVFSLHILGEGKTVEDLSLEEYDILHGEIEYTACYQQKVIIGKEGSVIKVLNYSEEDSKVKLTDLTEDQLFELLRQMYLLGGNDAEDDNFYWCPQGSQERVADVLEETVEDIINEY